MISAAFWGGIWGILLAAILRRTQVADLRFGAGLCNGTWGRGTTLLLWPTLRR